MEVSHQLQYCLCALDQHWGLRLGYGWTLIKLRLRLGYGWSLINLRVGTLGPAYSHTDHDQAQSPGLIITRVVSHLASPKLLPRPQSFSARKTVHDLRALRAGYGDGSGYYQGYGFGLAGLRLTASIRQLNTMQGAFARTTFICSATSNLATGHAHEARPQKFSNPAPPHSFYHQEAMPPRNH